MKKLRKQIVDDSTRQWEQRHNSAVLELNKEEGFSENDRRPWWPIIALIALAVTGILSWVLIS